MDVLKEKVADLRQELQEANEKVSLLEGSLSAANESISLTNTRLKEVTNELHKSQGEKLSLLRQSHQASSIAAKIKNDDKKTHLYTGLPSYAVFLLFLTHLSPIVSKNKSLGSGLTLEDELLVSLIKISLSSTNLEIANLLF